MRLLDAYDVIVVGAGSSGCALAARLSEDSNRSVLLVEAGPRYVGIDAYPPELKYGASFAAGMPGHPNNWGFPANLSPALRMPIPRGRVVGGSSAVNGTVFCRGLAEDFAGWASAGNHAWSFEEVLPFYRRLERDQDSAADFHGSEGPMPVRRTPRADWTSLSSVFVAACREAGFPADEDMNAPELIGVGALPLNNIGGIRINTALAYLDPIAERPNLHVLADTMVSKVRIVAGQAVGILARRGDETIEISAGEVVLSAGAIKSPHILMLSGVGPRDALSAHDIPVLHELPHVGRNFTDHCTLHFPLRIPRKAQGRVDPAVTPFSEVALHCTTPGSEVHSDLMLMQNVYPLNAAALQDSSLGQRVRALAFAMRQFSWAKLREQMTTHWDVAITIILMQGRSRGEIRLVSGDPSALPVVDYHYLEDPEDRRRLREGMRLAARLVASRPFRAIGARSAVNDTILASDAALDEHIRAHVSTSMHTSSSCRMGTSAEDSVVDQYCRVHGVANLRVVDTSIMPMVVRRCPNATAVMIGERAASFFA